MTDAERLTLLEERYAHLQRHVTQQDKAMLELGEELAKLRKDLLALRAQMTGGAPDSDDAAEERPPHY
jgi:SlyX protein